MEPNLISNTTQIYSFNKVRTISFKIADTPAIYPLLRNPLEGLNISPGETICTNTFLKNLKLYAKIRSLPEAAIPDIKFDDSETDKIYKALDSQWKSPRKQLNLYITNSPDVFRFNDGSHWKLLGSISLLNSSGYPYKRYNLLDLITDNLAAELGEDGNLGLSIIDVGWGYLDPSDEVNVSGSYVHEIIIKKEPVPVIINVTPSISLTPSITINAGSFTPTPTPTDEEDFMTALTPLTYTKTSTSTFPAGDSNSEQFSLVTANENRKYLLIINDKETPVTIELESLGASITIEPKGSFEINRLGLWYKGSINCFDDANFTLVEGV